MTIISMRMAVLVALLTLLGGCRGCACRRPESPAATPTPHELELVEQALHPAKYEIAVTELEKSPSTGLAAVRKRTAKPGTRDALTLKIMAHRLGAVSSHRAWREQFSASAEGLSDPLGPSYSSSIRGLISSRHTLFWSERLLHHRGDSEFDAAAEHLIQIGDAQAIETLSIVAREPWANGQFMFHALDALGQLGQGRALADGLAAHDGPNAQEGQLEYHRVNAREAAKKLLPKARTSTEAELLTALETEALDDVKRGSYLFILGQIGSATALPRLAELRRNEWGQRMKPAFDEAIAAIAERDAGGAP